MSKIKRSCVVAFALLLAGCTQVDVDRVTTGEERGMRYYLPQPFIVITPKANGTMDVRVDYYPDKSQQYAIDVDSFMASHELRVKVRNGLLTSVDSTSDSAAVAAAFAKSAGEVAEAKINADKAAEEAAKTAAAAMKAEQQKKVDGYESKLIELRADLRGKEALLANTQDEAEKRKLLGEIAAIKATIDLYEGLLGDARSALVGGAGFNAPVDDSSPGKTVSGFERGSIPGRVLLRLQECEGKLSLVPMNFGSDSKSYQLFHETYRVPSASGGGSKPSPLGLKTKELSFVYSDQVVKKSIEATRGVETAQVTSLIRLDLQQSVPDEFRPEAKADGGPTISVTFKPKTPRQEYRMTLLLFESADAKPVPVSVPVKVN